LDNFKECFALTRPIQKTLIIILDIHFEI